MSNSENLHLKKRAFLAAYTTCGAIGRAAEAAGLERHCHSDWLRDDPDYVAAFADARDAAGEALEVEARRRAVEGTRRYKFNKDGDPIQHPESDDAYYELDYSDTLLIFLMKGSMPEKYADRQHVRMEGIEALYADPREKHAEHPAVATGSSDASASVP